MLEPGLVIYKIYNGYWFFGRPTVEDLRQDLRAVLAKCRPDWDITTPELKTAWQQGRKEPFYPYGKPYADTTSEQNGLNVAGAFAQLRELMCEPCNARRVIFRGSDGPTFFFLTRPLSPGPTALRSLSVFFFSAHHPHLTG